MRKRPLIEAVLLEQAQRGWRCTMAFYVQTHLQSTDELRQVVKGGRSVLAALWNTYRAVLAERRARQAIPGPHWNTEVA